MRVSVIIPTLDEADRIGALIEALWADGFAEIIVTDGGSQDGTEEKSKKGGALVVRAPRGRGAQLRVGARAATGTHLFFLHADSTPPPDARAALLATLSVPGVAAGCFRLAFDQAHPLLAFYALTSRINHNLFTYGDQGLFLSRETYDRIGGYSDAPLFEDVEILARVRRAGKFVKRPEAITTSARRFQRHGVARREFASIGLVCLYHLGVSPEQLQRWYRPERAHRQ